MAAAAGGGLRFAQTWRLLPGEALSHGLVIKPHFLLHIAIMEELLREAGSSPWALSKL